MPNTETDTVWVIRMCNGIFVVMYRHLAYADTDLYKAGERLRREIFGG